MTFSWHFRNFVWIGLNFFSNGFITAKHLKTFKDIHWRISNKFQFSSHLTIQQVLTMYNVGYQLVNPTAAIHGPTSYPQIQNVINDRALINQRLQALMNMSCLRMRGLPFSAGQKDIFNFLGSHSDYVVSAVHIIYNLQVFILSDLINIINCKNWTAQLFGLLCNYLVEETTSFERSYEVSLRYGRCKVRTGIIITIIIIIVIIIIIRDTKGLVICFIDMYVHTDKSPVFFLILTF